MLERYRKASSRKALRVVAVTVVLRAPLCHHRRLVSGLQEKQVPAEAARPKPDTVVRKGVGECSPAQFCSHLQLLEPPPLKDFLLYEIAEHRVQSMGELEELSLHPPKR